MPSNFLFSSDDSRDKLELKAENDGSKSYAALEKKAELYEKLARGELPDEEEKEKYCVDFFQKSLTQDECKQPESLDTQDAQENENAETDDNMWLNSRPLGPGRTSVMVDNEEHKRFVRYASFSLVSVYHSLFLPKTYVIWRSVERDLFHANLE